MKQQKWKVPQLSLFVATFSGSVSDSDGTSRWWSGDCASLLALSIVENARMHLPAVRTSVISRGVWEWLSVFPIPPIPAWSFPFPFPKFMHCENYSHSHTIPSHSHSREITYKSKHFKRHSACNVFHIHRLRVTETRRSEYKCTDISDYSKRNRVK